MENPDTHTYGREREFAVTAVCRLTLSGGVGSRKSKFVLVN